MQREVTLGTIEGQFADIIWSRAPIFSSELVKIAEKEMNWKRTTTHTVIKKQCDKKLFQRDEKGIVTVLVSKDDFYAGQGKHLVDVGYQGSLPLFIAGFVSRQGITQKEIDEIIKMLKEK